MLNGAEVELAKGLRHVRPLARPDPPKNLGRWRKAEAKSDHCPARMITGNLQRASNDVMAAHEVRRFLDILSDERFSTKFSSRSKRGMRL